MSVWCSVRARGFAEGNTAEPYVDVAHNQGVDLVGDETAPDGSPLRVRVIAGWTFDHTAALHLTREQAVGFAMMLLDAAWSAEWEVTTPDADPNVIGRYRELPR